MGIDINKVIAMTFVIGAGLGAQLPAVADRARVVPAQRLRSLRPTPAVFPACGSRAIHAGQQPRE